MGVADVTDAGAWAQRLREPGSIERALARLPPHGPWARLQVGPVDSAQGARPTDTEAPIAVLHSLAEVPLFERAAFLQACGTLWTLGIDIDQVDTAVPAEGRRRLSLPTYPFERRRCWLDAAPASSASPRVPRAVL
jgi:acyl transferase domain-containing protein